LTEVAEQSRNEGADEPVIAIGPRSRAATHFALLDALRGVAAMIVCYGHAIDVHALHGIFPSFPLAVDFFFVLSGFVIALSYEARLIDRQMGFGRFAVIRLVRLYPLIFLSVVLGACVLCLRIVANREWHLVAALLLTVPFSLLVIPTPFLAQSGALGLQLYWPLNPPIWSLFFEIIANLVYAAAVRTLSNRLIAVILAASGVCYLAIALTFHTVAFGNDWDWPAGFIRVAYSFLAGVATYRVYAAQQLAWLRRLPSLAIIISLLICLSAGYLAIELIIVIFIFPILVLAGAYSLVPGSIRNLCLWLGTVSYPLYLLHFPLLRVWERVIIRSSSLSDSGIYMTEIGFLAFAMAFSALILKFYDIPVRRTLAKLVLNRS